MNTREFLNAIRPDGGLMVLVSIGSDDGAIAARTFELPDEMDRALEWVTEQNNRRNVYFGPNPPKTRLDKKPADADIGDAQWMWADIDAKDRPEQGYEAQRAALLNGVLHELVEGPTPPTLLVDSGHGLQPLLRLSEPMRDLEEARELNGRVGHALGGPGAHDPSRILRLPGTMNFPNVVKLKKGYPKEPTQATVLHESNATYTLEELTVAFPKVVTAKHNGGSERDFCEDDTPLTPDEVDITHLKALTLMDSDETLRRRWEGHSDGLSDTTRSGFDFSMMALLKARTFDYREARWVLTELFEHGAGRDAGDRYWQRCWMRTGADFAKFDLLFGDVEEAVKAAEQARGGERERLAQAVLGEVGKMPDAVRREQMLQRLQPLIGVPLQALRREVVRRAREDDDEGATHDTHARALLKAMTVKAQGAKPVGVLGQLFVYQPGEGVYVPLEVEQGLEVLVAQLFDGRDVCVRRSDYVAIAKQAYSRAGQAGFFDHAPAGLATPKGFVRIGDDGVISTEPMRPELRQRFLLPYAVADEVGEMPRFSDFLARTFGDDEQGREQVALLQELIGLTLTGTLHREQKVVLLMGVERSGKSTVQELLRALIPSAWVGSVPPAKWESDYHVAALAELRINLVGELDDQHPIPSGAFKSITGLDLVGGRKPYGMPFDFRVTAAHWFNSNQYPVTRDRHASFFDRWRVLSFEHTVPPDARVPEYGEAMAKAEGARIVRWALEGAARALARRRVGDSAVSREKVSAWRHRTNSVLAFLRDGDGVTLDPKAKTPSSRVYRAYQDWCSEEGRKYLSQQNFVEVLRHDGPAVGVRYRRTREAREVLGVGLEELCVFSDDDEDLV
jgi:P4 family phage/plasmid primase-like protien